MLFDTVTTPGVLVHSEIKWLLIILVLYLLFFRPKLLVMRFISISIFVNNGSFFIVVVALFVYFIVVIY